MIERIVAFALRERLLVILLTITLIIAGVMAFKQLPIEAYPDVADTWVQIITQWPGHAAEEVERQITVPLEIEMNGIPHHTSLRSVSLFGLSAVTLLFDERTPTFTARQCVLEKLPQVNLPPGLQPTLAPMSSPVGQIFFYVLDSPLTDIMRLKELNDWVITKLIKQVPGVADVVSFGGTVKQYQVLVNPVALANYALTIPTVVQALSNNNRNAGGGFINQGDQAYNIRGVGVANSVQDLQNVIIAAKAGTPIRVQHVAQVMTGPQPRLGKISLSEHHPDGSCDERNDVVTGIVLSRVGEHDERVLEGLHEKVKEINEKTLPANVTIKPYLDRSKLIHLTTHTVERNMTMGMILVTAVLMFFLGHIRSACIVAVTVPLALLFAAIFLNIKDIPANLLSLGALDFGMIVDAAVVMVENIFRHKETRMHQGSHGKGSLDMIPLVQNAAREVQRPMVYASMITILAYLPIFTLQRVEGRLFTPMAWTVASALLGSLLLSLTTVPVLSTFFLKGDLTHWSNPLLDWVRWSYRRGLLWGLEHRSKILGIGVTSFLLTVYLAFGGPIGSEFLPHLDEGSIWVRGTLPPSASYELADRVVHQARQVFMTFPEVPIAVCQEGRPDDGTDATGFFNLECFVDLQPHSQWRRDFQTKEDLIEAMNRDLAKIPGVTWNFSQPISDNMEEMIAGVKGALVVKLFGSDLKTMTQKANEIMRALTQVSGIEDLGLFEELGQPNINIVINRDKISRYGLNISDVQDVIETAVGGKVASSVLDGEKRFDVVVRYQPPYRDTVEHIRRILVATPEGFRVPLEELADIRIENGPSMIYREGNTRYIAVKFSVRGRSLGSTIAEAQDVVKKSVLLPPGYQLKWSGEFENQRRAEARLAVVIPLTILAIFFVLFLVFDSFKWALLIMVDVAMARVGGVLALFVSHTNFSVSSGIGFLAVFGVSVQTGVLLVSYINQLRKRGIPLPEAVVEGALLRLRPIMMTALVGTLGLVPAAFSHAIGSDSQRPMAIVIVGGLLTDLVMGLFLLPVLYHKFAKPTDKLKG